MNGDYKGDFTRDTFDPFKHFSRVLMQQGRVQLDADWNEQTDILLRYIRHLAQAIIGTHGGPKDGSGFVIGTISDEKDNFSIGTGDYYVDGILVENRAVDKEGKEIPKYTYKDHPDPDYHRQPYYQPVPLRNERPRFFQEGYNLLFLDMWEQQITYLEEESIREVALGVGGPDTATRARVVWQVKVMDAKEFDKDTSISLDTIALEIQSQSASPEKFLQIKTKWIPVITARLRERFPPKNQSRGQLKARARVEVQDITDVCITSPDSQYRGNQNQLYRVEVHSGGSAWSKDAGSGAAFKWSRENGSVVFPIVPNDKDNEGNIVLLQDMGRDDHSTLQKDDWVEVVDDDSILKEQPDALLHVDAVDPLNMQVTLSGKANYNKDKHPLLRRWDQKPRVPKKDGEPDLFDAKIGTVKIVEGQGEGQKETYWITLEDGVQIQFQQNSDQPNTYRTGDYWLIPARTITGDVEWPTMKADPAQHIALPPLGVDHHYAPLAIIHIANGEIQQDIIDLRFVFSPIVTPAI